jgi:predicted permease
MPKAMQKTLLKLGIAGFAGLLVFNYPLLSLYRGTVGTWPVLYVLLFGAWLLLILIARRVTEPSVAVLFKAKADREAP